jgi:hypothetical protein
MTTALLREREFQHAQKVSGWHLHDEGSYPTAGAGRCLYDANGFVPWQYKRENNVGKGKIKWRLVQ